MRFLSMPWFGLCAAMLGFLAVSWPVISYPGRYHPDERLYTDAVLRMAETGDYVTPYFADGRKRFQKPILTYWFVALGWNTVGPSFAAARASSCLAGGAILWLVWRQAWLLFRSGGIAWLAVAMLLSNMTFLVSSWRATPDVFLCLFMNVSLYGFMRVALRGDRSTSAYMAAYVGAGLAVAVKGALGLLPIGLALAYSGLRRWRSGQAMGLLHWRAMLLGMVLACGWFVAVIGLHGREVWASFYYDQITENVSGSGLRILKSVGTYLLAPWRHFLPWSVLVVLALAWSRDGFRTFVRERRDEMLFIALWVLIVTVVFCAGSYPRARYLFPMYPLVSCLFAAWVSKALDDTRFERTALNVCRWAAAGLGTVTGCALIAAGVRCSAMLFVGGCLLLVGGCAGLLIGRNFSRAAASVAVVMLLLVCVAEVFVKPVFVGLPEQKQAEYILARCGKSGSVGAKPEVACVGFSKEFGGRLRLLLRGDAKLTEFGELPEAGALDSYRFVIGDQRLSDSLPRESYAVNEIGYEYEKWHATDVIRLFTSPDPAGYLAARRVYCRLAERR